MNTVTRFLFVLVLGFHFVAASAESITAPRLNFTDLISGSSTGIGDGKGGGVIVTVWGQNLLDAQGTSAIVFTDVKGETHANAHVYYWKNADGLKPSGIANLYDSHKMQEIAISIPEGVPNGAGTIHVKVNNIDSNKLPFTIRDGDIYHVKLDGDDNNLGSFAKPFLTIPGALSSIDNPGSTVYVHDSLVNESVTRFSVYWNNGSASSGYDNQFGVVAYPGSHPEVIGNNGFSNFKAQGQVVSKFHVKASNCDELADGQPGNCRDVARGTVGIKGSAYGRIVGNAITDSPGGCANAQQGAISGKVSSELDDTVSGLQIFGNEIYEYGCPGTSKFHHTTYMTVRNGSDPRIDAWRFGWNYLHDNDAKNGIHNYDQLINGGPCGSPVGTLYINDNVIINQAGAGIHVGASCPWSNEFSIYNNVLINVGLASSWDGKDPLTSFQGNTGGITIDDNNGLAATVDIFNNTVINWNGDDVNYGAASCFGLIGGGNTAKVFWRSNLCITDKDKSFFTQINDSQLDDATSVNNSWFYRGENPAKALPPEFIDNITGDPRIKEEQTWLSLDKGSSIINKGIDYTDYDVYGVRRTSNQSIGAVEYALKPNYPTSVLIK